MTGSLAEGGGICKELEGREAERENFKSREQRSSTDSDIYLGMYIHPGKTSHRYRSSQREFFARPPGRRRDGYGPVWTPSKQRFEEDMESAVNGAGDSM